jgi:transposase InsO family protein
MKLHANAALTLRQRRRMVSRVVEHAWSVAAAAAAENTSSKTCGKWVSRYRDLGESGLRDRSSAPKHQARQTSPERVAAIAALRRLRLSGPEIAELLEMPVSTVSGVLKRAGVGRLGRVGLEPARRYERQRPGELIHVDVKKLGRIQVPGHRVTGNRRQRARGTRVGNRGRYLGTAGWVFVHIAIDDATRLAYAEVLDDETAASAVGFLRRAAAFYRRHGISVERLLTDNGSPYRSAVHAIACRELGIRHLRTRPYRPQTNGKAERFIRTMLNSWAYGPLYGSSQERTAALDGWLWHYNHRRRHTAIGRQAPISRLNNLISTYT